MRQKKEFVPKTVSPEGSSSEKTENTKKDTKSEQNVHEERKEDHSFPLDTSKEAQSERIKKTVAEANQSENKGATEEKPKRAQERNAPSNAAEQKEDHETPTLNSDNYRGDLKALQTISKICVESGFEATGRPVKKFPINFFESSGLHAKFCSYLSDNLDKGCNLSRSETEHVLNSLRRKRQAVSFCAAVVSGVPGCGKTTLLKKIQTSAGLRSAVVLGNSALSSQFSNIPFTYTAKEILLLDLEIYFDTLLIDEYTLLSNGEILLLQRICKSRYVFLFGDRAQGSQSTLCSPEWLQIPTVFLSTISRRFGKATADLCKEQGYDFDSNGNQDSVSKVDYEGDSPATEINLVVSEATRADIAECGISSTLAQTVQGKEFESVTVFLLEEDLEILKDPHLLAVLITRHRSLLVLRCPKEVFVSLLTGEFRKEINPTTHTYGKQ